MKVATFYELILLAMIDGIGIGGLLVTLISLLVEWFVDCINWLVDSVSSLFSS